MLLNASDLKYFVRSVGCTLSNSGVSPSYIFAWVSAPAGIGKDPYWPDGTMFRAVAAKSLALAVAGTANAAQARTQKALRIGRTLAIRKLTPRYYPFICRAMITRWISLVPS